MLRACHPPADGGGLTEIKPNRVGSASRAPGSLPADGGGLMRVKPNRVGSATRLPGSPPAAGGGLTRVKPNRVGSATRGQNLTSDTHQLGLESKQSGRSAALAAMPAHAPTADIRGIEKQETASGGEPTFAEAIVNGKVTPKPAVCKAAGERQARLIELTRGNHPCSRS